MKRLFSCCLLIILACSSVWADELFNITVPTKIVISDLNSELKIELPTISSKCTYEFLEEGLRGVIDCPGTFPSFSKTFPLKANNFIKQVRIGIHKDKLRIVLDLVISIPSSLNTAQSKNNFKFSTPAPSRTVGKVPEKPIMFAESVENVQRIIPTPTENPAIKKPTVAPTPTVRVTEIPVTTPTPTAKPTEIPTPTVVPTKISSNFPTITKEKELSEELPLALETLEVNFNEGDRLIRDVVVTNNSGSQKIVTVDCYLDLEHQAKSEEVHSDNDSPGSLTPSPRKFTLGDGQKRAVRFILALKDSVGKSDSEISFVARFSDPDGELLAPKIAFTYVPKQLLPKLVATPLNGKLKLTNSGNASVELSAGKCCRLDDCQAVNTTHLGAGRSVTLDVPEDCQLEFVREFKGSFQKFKVGREILNDASL